MTAQAPVAVRATDLPRDNQQAYCETTAQLAWVLNQTVVVVGTDDAGRVQRCYDVDCCILRPGVLVVVPDVDVVQLGHVPHDAVLRMERRDGRTAYVVPGGVA